jgi:hypothetical protein
MIKAARAEAVTQFTALPTEAAAPAQVKESLGIA